MGATLDLSRPVALPLISVLHFIRDGDDPYGVVRHLASALPPGSYLAMSHATKDFLPPTDADAVDNSDPDITLRLRTRAEVARFFEGHDLVAPGIVGISEWHNPEPPGRRPAEADVACYGAVARIR